MFPQDVIEWLRSNQFGSYAAHVAASVPSSLRYLDELGVPIESELAHFYLNYGPSSVRGWYALNEIETIAEWTQYARSELGVPEHFLAPSGVEGQGVILFNKNDGSIFDVEYGEFDLLAAGTLRPLASSVVNYLRWCMAKEAPTNKSFERTREG